MQQQVTVLIYDLQGVVHQLEAKHGSNLREVLLEAGLSPYTSYTQRLNCGGNGICATCGVWIEAPVIRPRHWHDRAAKQFGYPRLSCQISVEEDMIIKLVKKRIWGGRKKSGLDHSQAEGNQLHKIE